MKPQMDSRALELVGVGMDWLDSLWDDSIGLIRSPRGYPHGDGRPVHMVRESVYYALGLLSRGRTGDPERALAAIKGVLRHQYDVPGTVFQGTWRRMPTEPMPGAAPVEWRDYDPNWREFIGTALLVVLQHFEADLPPELVKATDRSLALAVEGTLARNLPASYTNIALMRTWILDAVGTRSGNASLSQRARESAADILARFQQFGVFDEYNSPTYYGVDLAGLAMWRQYGSPALRDASLEMEAALWRDIGRYYHAGLKNLCGPYDRSYGMDLNQYCGLIGLWIWLAIGRDAAPFPKGDSFDHAWDFAPAPLYAVLGVKVPSDVLPHFTRFSGPRWIEQKLPGQDARVATAYLDERFMFGGERGGPTPPSNQAHHCTLHWLSPAGKLCWARANAPSGLDATASAEGLYVIAKVPGEAIVFEFNASTERCSFQTTHWTLPGLHVEVDRACETAAESGWTLRVLCRPSGVEPAQIRLSIRSQREPTTRS